MSNPVIHPQYTHREEVASSLTHGAGIVASITGLVVLCCVAVLYGGTIELVAGAIFGASMILCYTSSTLYHSIRTEHLRPLMRAIDHSAIFILIAGTYTPFMLISLRGPWGWTILSVIWSLAVLGIVLRLGLRGRLHGLVVGLYVAMGWAIVVAIKPLVVALAPGGLWLLVGGGLAYTGGIVFYKWKSLPYNHAIWHLFVLLGSTLHFFAVLFYVMPWTTA